MAKELEIVAKSKGTECGREILSWPETFDEAGEDAHGGKEFAYQMYHQGRVVHERAKLYPKPEGTGKSVSKEKVYNTVLEATGDADLASKAAQGWSPEGEESQPDVADENVA